MSDIDFEKLLKVAESDKAAQNAMTFTDMLKEAEGVVKLAEKVVSVFDRAGALPGMVRAVGKKYDVDVETPLRTREDHGISPNTAFHREIMLQLNDIQEDSLREQFQHFTEVLKNGAAQPDLGTD